MAKVRVEKARKSIEAYAKTIESKPSQKNNNEPNLDNARKI